ARVPEDPAEDVAEIAEVDVGVVDVRSAARAGAAAAASVRRAVAVVLLPLLLVGEDVVRRLHLLEALLRGLVAGIRVGMVLACELPVRLLDFVLRGVLLHSERVVKRAHSATITRAGRTTRSPSL